MVWNEAAVDRSEALFQNLPGESTKIFSQCSESGLIPGNSDYEAEMILTELSCSVWRVFLNKIINFMFRKGWEFIDLMVNLYAARRTLMGSALVIV
jgi:hypothetical protein